jgi:hypothetical protein
VDKDEEVAVREEERKKRLRAYFREERRHRDDEEKKARNMKVVENRGGNEPRVLTREEAFARIRAADERAVSRMAGGCWKWEVKSEG